MAVPIIPPVFNEHGDRQSGGFFREIFVSGYDEKFVCRQCHRILRDPVQGHCGHRFCRSCLQDLLRNSSVTIDCPACIEEKVEAEELGKLSTTEMFPDNGVKREMSGVATACMFPGCSWKGKFKAYEAHEKSCQYRQIACAQCGKPVVTGHIEEHRQFECLQRHVSCEYCNADVIFENMPSHYSVCQKVPMECNLCKKGGLHLDQMKYHMEQECPKRPAICPMGCTEKFSADRFSEHLHAGLERHLAWTVEKMVVLEHRLEESVGGVSGVASATSLQQIMAGINGLEKKVQSMERQLQHLAQHKSSGSTSEPSPSGTADFSDKTESGAASENTKAKVSTEVAAKRSLLLVEPILGVIHTEMERTAHNVQVLEGHYRQQQARLDEIIEQFRVQQQQIQLKDAAIADLELRLAAQEMARYDGTILWKVSGFEAKKKEAISGQTTSLYSPAFFSGPCGYKMCARIYPNGDGIGKGSHISLFFVIMRGHYDALLPWPFSQKVTLMMIDQNHREHIVDAFKPDPNSTSFKRPSTEMNIASGCPLFLPLEKLHSPNHGYLRQDTIFVKIIVDTDGLDRFTEMNPGRFATHP